MRNSYASAFDVVTVVIVVAAAIRLGARLGLPTYSLVTGLGVGGLAVALAGREALSNLIGTIAILLDRPFKLGDFVVLGEGDAGTVTEIGLRSTRLKRLDGILVSIPNASIANMNIINESAPVAECQITVSVGAAYGSSVNEVEQALLTASQRCEYALPEPAPSVRLVSFGDSALEFPGAGLDRSAGIQGKGNRSDKPSYLRGVRETGNRNAVSAAGSAHSCGQVGGNLKVYCRSPGNSAVRGHIRKGRRFMRNTILLIGLILCIFPVAGFGAEGKQGTDKKAVSAQIQTPQAADEKAIRAVQRKNLSLPSIRVMPNR